MKFLTIIAGITALAVARETVKARGESTLDQIKGKAQELHQQFDTDKDGHVSLEELSEGVKKGLGFGNDEKERSDPSYASQLYERFVLSDQDKADRKWFTEEDFEEIFRSKAPRRKQPKNKKKKHSKKSRRHQKDDENSLIDEIRNKSNEIYERFDKNHDGHVSLEELREGLMEGLGFGDQEQQKTEKRDEKSLTQYANELYEKYVKSDEKGKQSFSRQDFYNIVNQNRQSSILQKARNKASEAFKSLDTDNDGHISLQELKNWMKSGMGMQDDDEEKDEKTISERANELYEKYVKPDGKGINGFTLEDVQNIIADKYRAAKKRITKKASQIKDAIQQRFESEDESEDDESTIERIKQRANQIYDRIDTDRDGHISLEQLRAGLKSKLGFDSDDEDEEDEKDEKSLADRAQELYNKYVKSDKKDSFTKEDFYNLFSSERKSKKHQSFLARTQKRAEDLYSKFDTNKDGHVTFEELTAGVKSGLGFGTDDEEEDERDENAVTSYVKDLYERYVKSDDKDKDQLTLEDFSDIVRRKARKAKNQCKRVAGETLDALKAKAEDIHDRFDTNDDGKVTSQEVATGIKQKLGFEEEDEHDDDSLFNFVRKIYNRHRDGGVLDQVKLTKQDFTDIVYRWREQCPVDAEEAEEEESDSEEL